MHVRNVHSFIVHCFHLTEYKVDKSTESWQLLHMLGHGFALQTTWNTSLWGTAFAFYKVQNKDLFFKQVTLVYFIHYTFFLAEKNKIVQLHKYKILPP